MLYAITDRRLYGADEAARRKRLLELTETWAAQGVAFIQLREKDLCGRELLEFARAMVRRLGPESATRLLINSRPDVALAAGAHGVHLSSAPGALTPQEVRAIFALAGRTQAPYISVSCHDLEEVAAARRQRADGILFAPVFEKKIGDRPGETLPGVGLEKLAEACRAAAPVPVFALGGVTAKNAPQCRVAGAAGIAAIRLMQDASTEPVRKAMLDDLHQVGLT